MILSASRRTDIPCYYAEWFITRLKAGYALMRNPMNHSQLSRIQLSPEVVDCIVFWTKDAENIIPYLGMIDDLGYQYYFQFTITPYDNVIERNLRSKSDIENTFIRLSDMIGKKRVRWRYDPIVLNDVLTIDYHKEHFTRMCEKLSPYTESVTVSFVDTYAKLKTDLIRTINNDEMAELSQFIAQTVKNYGITVKACCEKAELSVYGIEKASCIDKAIIEEILLCSLDLTPDKNQRNNCGCMESIDIGAYNTCMNGCIYCYANNNFSSTKQRYLSHNSNSELLSGIIADGEKISERKIKSHKQAQLRLF